MMKNFGCMAQSFGLVVTRQHEIHNRLVTVFLIWPIAQHIQYDNAISLQTPRPTIYAGDFLIQ